MSMFQKSVINGIKQDESLVALRWAKFQEFLAKVDYIKTVKEEKYQDGFLKDVFENCLGYTLDMTNPSNYNLEREKKNETDGKKADGVIYVDNKVIGVIELKAQDTKNLDKIETQAFNYHASHSNSKYIIISNFDELRFYIDKKTAYEKFSLFTLSYEEFKKLHLLISYESIKEDIPLKLKEKTATFEQNISKELYKDFSTFRTHLFENIIKNNENIDKSTLLRLTQKLCDRIIFILFAEDRGLLTPNTIKEIISRHQQDVFGNSMYEYYKIYFNAINEGNEKLNIPKYNGGLFAKDELLDNLKIDDENLNMEAQKLSSYNFESEISVNILGHIFEQSLTDLEELQANIENTNFDKTKSKRKKDGVFYTPEYITKYIVENTLGIMCLDKREELNLSNITAPVNPKKLTKAEQQTKDNLLIYKDWLFNLKILDPACGSGAFLNQALEYLIKEHKQLQNDLALMGDLFSSYTVEESVLEHNLYGVDINEEAVEIARLSLWLRTAQRGRALTNLNDKIKCGNSLIDDKNVVPNAFVWEEEFKEVFENGGFDVVIGNPPYVVLSQNDISNIYFNKYYFVSKGGKTNLYKLFFEKAINILKINGLLGFITPSNYLTSKDSLTLRSFLINNTKISNIIEYSESDNVFENVIQSVAILTLKKEIANSYIISFFNKNFQKISILNKKEITDKNLTIKSENIVIKKMKSQKYKFDEFIEGFQGEINVSTKKDYFISSQKINFLPLIRGNHIGKYFQKEKTTEYCPIEIDKRNHYKIKRIIFQEVSNNGLKRRINAFISSNVLCGHTTNYMFSKNIEIDIKTILAITNSKLINYYFKYFNMTNHVAIGEIKKIPIFNILKIEQNDFIQKADLLLELNKKLQETKQNFYDELKLEKLTTKLQKFEELEFDDFIKEYTKSKKIKFADKLEERNFKNDWKALFENDKKEVLEIQNQINITDKEIDQMVYKLYDLSDDEIKIVENT